MREIIDYIFWRGDLSCNKIPLNYIDCAALSQLTLLDLDGIVDTKSITMSRAANKFFRQHRQNRPIGVMCPKDLHSAFKAMGESKRFGQIKLHDRIDLIDLVDCMQLTAMCADVLDTRVVIFSGTGDTVVSWKEDFNLINRNPIPSQREAVAYLERMASDWTGALYVVGHSKGGNLTLYAVTHCIEQTQHKLTQALSFDGPGLNADSLDEMKNSPVLDKILSILPSESIFGRMFEHAERIRIVKSHADGMYQHDLYYWEVGIEDFVYQSDFTAGSNDVDQLIRSWVKKLNNDEKTKLIDGVFGMINATKSKTLLEVYEHRKELVLQFFKADAKLRKLLIDIFLSFMSKPTVRTLALKNITRRRKESKSDTSDEIT